MLESSLRAWNALHCLKDVLGLGGLVFLSTSAITVLRVSAVFQSSLCAVCDCKEQSKVRLQRTIQSKYFFLQWCELSVA